jgi:ParB-like chromosome segregation protein Spo0J
MPAGAPNTMKTEIVKISEVKTNPNNPRIIKDDKFQKLVNSIKEFPKMLEIRPIVVNDDMIVLGGNMRLKACKEAGLKEVPIIKASDLTEDEQRQFIIKDNVSGGEWDWEILANEWDVEQLEEWGLDVPTFAPEVDYSILDEEDVEDQLNEMTNGVKKAIQIEFESEHYEEAYALVKFWREREAYVGGMIMEYLKAEKEKI